jgi:D-amino-acid dehydrogenase
MKTIVLGAGIVGTATAYFLAKQGHTVEVIERQSGAGLETSFGNGGVIHASEVEPWSQPGMPSKIWKWLGKEDAPLLVRYGAIPHMWRWGMKFIANCTPERFRRNSLVNLRIALHSLKVLQQIRVETGIEYDVRTVGVLKIYTSKQSFETGVKSAEFLSTQGLTFQPADAAECLRKEPALAASASSLVGGVYFPCDEVGDCHKFTTALAKRCADLGVAFHYGTTIQRLERKGDRIAAVETNAGRLPADNFVATLASHTPGILRGIGIDVPIYPVKGVTITVPAAAWPDRTQMPIIDDGRLFGLVPLGDRMRDLRLGGGRRLRHHPEPGALPGDHQECGQRVPGLREMRRSGDGEILGRGAAGDANGDADPRPLAASESLYRRRPRPSRLDHGLRLRPCDGRSRHGATAGDRPERLRARRPLKRSGGSAWHALRGRQRSGHDRKPRARNPPQCGGR